MSIITNESNPQTIIINGIIIKKNTHNNFDVSKFTNEDLIKSGYKHIPYNQDIDENSISLPFFRGQAHSKYDENGDLIWEKYEIVSKYIYDTNLRPNIEEWTNI